MNTLITVLISALLIAPAVHAETMQDRYGSETHATGVGGIVAGTLVLTAASIANLKDMKKANELAEILQDPAPLTEANFEKFKGHIMYYELKDSAGNIFEEKFVVNDLDDMKRFEKERRKLAAHSRNTISLRSHAGRKIGVAYLLGTGIVLLGAGAVASEPAPESSYIDYEPVEVAE